VKVCDRWLTFANFLADMGERPPGTTLDRYPDNEGDYEPSNCRWTTRKNQSRNRHNTVRVDFHGGKVTLKEAAERIGMPYQTLFGRYRKGDRDADLFRPRYVRKDLR
jgi:hypothetical protein